MSLTFDDLTIGDSAETSKTVTETDVVLYAGLTGDFNPVHMDAEYARTTPFGERIAHGTLTQGLIAPVIGNRLPGSGCVLLSMFSKFIAPVRIGDTITARAEVAELDARRRFVKLALIYTNQRGESVATGEALVKPRSAD